MSDLTVLSQPAPAPPCTMVIFGASGDLAKKKLLPALYALDRCGEGLLSERTAIVGCARRALKLEEFKRQAREGIAANSRLGLDPDCWAGFGERLDYVAVADSADGFGRLKSRLEEIESARGLDHSRVFYLAIPPEAIVPTVSRLSASAMITSPAASNFTRVVIEKPIGHSLSTAIEIERALCKYLDESQIFRIDHYLGKEAVQNLMVLRFANSIFEQLWNSRQIDHVQLTVAESEGVGTRAGYYDRAGALRDIVQNHLLQILALTAMEPPISLDAAAVHSAKLDVLRALRPFTSADVKASVVRARYTAGVIANGQVPGYLDEAGVAKDSKTETFVALKVWVDNWRWSGVPFYLRTGKRMAARASEIVIRFKEVPQILFNRARTLPADVLTLRVQPDEGVSLDVVTKQPGLGVAVGPARINLRYSSEFGTASPEAYERLLLDVMDGDRTLFIHRELVEQSWKFVQTILDVWADDPTIAIDTYPAGSWGPVSADALIGADHRAWHTPAT